MGVSIGNTKINLRKHTKNVSVSQKCNNQSCFEACTVLQILPKGVFT